MMSEMIVERNVQHFRRQGDRRGEQAPAVRRAGDWTVQLLNHIDYGIVVLGADLRMAFANGAACALLARDHPLHIRGDELCTRHLSDLPRLRQAVEASAARGLRSLLALGAEQDDCVSVVPLLPPQPGQPGTAMLVLGRAPSGDDLSAQWFARNHGLTLAECRVLALLCVGEAPGEIAHRQGVAISTVRTQIGSIRAKTGTRSVGALIRRVSSLPPLVNTLQSGLAP